MDLIPGLPNDLALECLFRIPFSQIQSLRSVCKAWKSEIKHPEFFHLRKSKAQPIIILSQVNMNSVPRLMVFDPETGFSSDMPPLPESKKLPFDCMTAIVGSKLVVMGGYDEETDRCVDSVFIFDFYSSTWHPGVNMPDGPRRSFACAVYDDRTVFVAGGRNSKSTYTSAWTYDVASNNWNQLPDMIKDRDMAYRSNGFIYQDKFEVLNIKEGHWNVQVQIFDISARQWSEARRVFLTYPRCVEGFDHNLYNTDRDNNLVVREEDKWKPVARLPANCYLSHLIASPGHFWLICASDFKEPYSYFKMDMKDRNWIMGKVSINISGFIDSGYSLIV